MVEHKPNIWLYSTLVILTTISSMATNLYVPAMPAMGQALKVSEHLMQHSLSIYMLAFAIIPMGFAPVADRVGARSMILTTLVLSLISHAFILTATTKGLLLGRFLQGGALGLVTISARALLATLFSGKALARAQSWTQCFGPLVTIASPLLGGVIFQYTHWQGIFIFFSLYVGLTWGISYCTVPDTPLKSSTAPSFNQYLCLLKSPDFMKVACLPAMVMIGQSAYVCKSAYILQTTYHLSPLAYGLCSIPVYSALILGAMINIALLKHYEPKTILKVGASLMILGAIIIGMGFLWHKDSIVSIILGCSVYFLSNSLLATNAYAVASEQADSQNCAFALMSLIKMSAGVIITSLAAYCSNQMTTLMLFFMLAGLLGLGLVQDHLDLRLKSRIRFAAMWHIIKGEGKVLP